MTPATPDDFWRLAEEARRRGIWIYREPSSGDYFATSASDNRRLHRVSGCSCSCPGFAQHRRCSHHAALLDLLGWLPDPAPDPAAAPLPPAPENELPCPLCGEAPDEACPVCEGSGVVAAWAGAS